MNTTNCAACTQPFAAEQLVLSERGEVCLPCDAEAAEAPAGRRVTSSTRTGRGGGLDIPPIGAALGAAFAQRPAGARQGVMAAGAIAGAMVIAAIAFTIM